MTVETIIISCVIGAFAGGVYLGGCLSAYRWAENAKHPMRMLYRGKFYKVTNPDEKDF